MSVTCVAAVGGVSSSWDIGARGVGGAGKVAAGSPRAACRAARTGRRTARSSPASGSTRQRSPSSYSLLCLFLSSS